MGAGPFSVFKISLRRASDSQAPVGLNYLPRYVSRLIREQEGRDLRNLLHASVTAQGDLLYHLLLVFIRERACHVRLDQPERERIDGDVPFRDLFRESFREAY